MTSGTARTLQSFRLVALFLCLTAIAMVAAACGTETATIGAGPTGGRGESVSVAHRVLIDGVADESREPWSTAVLSAAEVWDIDPEVEIGDEEVLLGFWLAESESCPLEAMVDLHYDTEFQVIYPQVPGSGDDRGCDEEANAHLVVVAVPRSKLPTGALTLWVNGGEPRPDGATFVADGQLTTMSEGALPFPVLEDPGQLAVGETKVAIGLTTHCGLERLYWPIDDRQWLVAGQSGVPSEWGDQIRSESIDLVITRTADDELEVTTLGTRSEGVSYVPAPDIEGCD